MLLALALNAARLKSCGTGALALVLIRIYPADEGRVETVRSFFGVHKIVTTPNGQYHVLMHGTTIHGAEKYHNANGTQVAGRPEPITYYHKDGGIGRAITAIRERKGAPLRVAVIGLGSGTLTCASAPGETWKFFEIDQSMVDTARDPKYFTYRQEMRARAEANHRRRAADLCARAGRHLRPDHRRRLFVGCDPDPSRHQRGDGDLQGQAGPQGVVVMHVSNRHLELASVVVGIADANGLKSWVYDEDSGRDSEYIFATNRRSVGARGSRCRQARFRRSNGQKPTPTRTSGSGPTIIATCWARSIGGYATANNDLNRFYPPHVRERAALTEPARSFRRWWH